MLPEVAVQGIRTCLLNTTILVAGVQGGDVECVCLNTGRTIDFLIRHAKKGKSPCAVLGMAFEEEKQLLFVSTVNSGRKGSIIRGHLGGNQAEWSAPKKLPDNGVGRCIAILRETGSIAVGTECGRLYVLNQLLDAVTHRFTFNDLYYDAINCCAQLGEGRGIVLGTNLGITIHFGGDHSKAGIVHDGKISGLNGRYNIGEITANHRGSQVAIGTRNQGVVLLDARKNLWHMENGEDWPVLWVIPLPDAGFIPPTAPPHNRRRSDQGASRRPLPQVVVTALKWSGNDKELYIGCQHPEPCYAVFMDGAYVSYVGDNQDGDQEAVLLTPRTEGTTRHDDMPRPSLRKIAGGNAAVCILSINNDSKNYVLDELGRIECLPSAVEDADLPNCQGNYGVHKDSRPWRAGPHAANERRHGLALKPTYDEFRIDSAIMISKSWQADTSPHQLPPRKYGKHRYSLMQSLKINPAEDWALRSDGWSNRDRL